MHEPVALARFYTTYKHLPAHPLTTHFVPTPGLDEVSLTSQLVACFSSRFPLKSFRATISALFGGGR